MTSNDFPILRLKKNEERRIYSGHLWAFSNEFVEVPKNIAAGSIVKIVRDLDERFVAFGFYNPHSLIAARILSRDPVEQIDTDFFRRRLVAAADRRALLLSSRNSARIVHSESDLLPGLVIDKFDDAIAFQISSAGFEVRKDELIALIEELWKPRAIVEKNATHTRTLEGLEQIERLVKGDSAEALITDSAGSKFTSDILTGQKTGFYLDQMENRTELRRYVKPGMKVLDLFSNDGGFAINLAAAGAASVIAVDSSVPALKRLKLNASANRVAEKITTVARDCFDFLQEQTEALDMIVVDPPSLVKSKRDLPQAVRSYQSLNQHALRLVAPEGVLFTASCSHHMSRDLLAEVIQEAARKSRRTVTVLEERGAGIDHPILVGMPETAYLHAFVLRVL